MEPDLSHVDASKRVALAIVAKQRAYAAVPMKFCDGSRHQRAFLLMRADIVP
jgi:hypothetical protein